MQSYRKNHMFLYLLFVLTPSMVPLLLGFVETLFEGGVVRGDKYIIEFNFSSVLLFISATLLWFSVVDIGKYLHSSFNFRPTPLHIFSILFLVLVFPGLLLTPAPEHFKFSIALYIASFTLGIVTFRRVFVLNKVVLGHPSYSDKPLLRSEVVITLSILSFSLIFLSFTGGLSRLMGVRELLVVLTEPNST